MVRTTSLDDVNDQISAFFTKDDNAITTEKTARTGDAKGQSADCLMLEAVNQDGQPTSVCLSG